MLNATCDCIFPIAATNQCHGLSQIKTASSGVTCEAACCSDCACTVWQFLDSKGCWIGSYEPSKCYNSTTGWAGAATLNRRYLPFQNVTACGIRDNQQVSTHTIVAPAAADAIQLSLDVPSPTTGTGTKLILDGKDTAMIGAAIVDSKGNLITWESYNITFRVASAHGRISGTGNGDPSSHNHPKSTTVATFFGWARVYVQVTQDCMSSFRELIRSIDKDQSNRTSVKQNDCDLTDIVVEASSDRLNTGSVSIHVSIDAADTPLEVAARTANSLRYSYLDEFRG